MPRVRTGKLRRVIAAATFLFAAFSPSLASAFSVSQVTVEPVGDFVVEPAKIELTLEPGETVTKTVTVTSRISGETDFSISLEDFLGTDNGSYAVRLLGDQVSPYSFRSAIRPDASSFSLGFGERAVVSIEIAAPAAAAPGGYYTSVVVAGDPRGDTLDGGGAKVVSRVAQLLFVRVDGEVEESGALLDFRLSPPGFFRSGGPFQFEALFQNTGNVHLAPYGSVTVRNLIGSTVAEIPVDAYYAMPKSMRYRTVEWPGKPMMLGYYTAEIELYKGYGDEGDTSKATVSFLVIPWLYLGIAAVALLLSWLATRYVRRNFELKRR